MAHNLASKNGKYSFVAAKKPGWHGLGTVLGHIFTAQEAIEHGGLDYEVKKQPLYINDAEGSQILVPDRFATVRQDTSQPLGVVGSRYTVVQNWEAFSFFDAIVGEGQAIYETAGALGNGERIFITAKLPQQMVIAPDDVIQNFLFLANAHDGSMAITAMLTSVRVVCENTFNLALTKHGKAITLRHSKSVHQNLQTAHQLMGIVKKESDLAEVTFRKMTQVRITDSQLKAFIEMAMMPGKEQISSEDFSKRFTNTIDNILNYTASDATQLMVSTKGTLYGAMNAITGFYNNVRAYKDAENRLDTIMYGSGARNNARAYNLAIDFMDGKTKLETPELILA